MSVARNSWGQTFFCDDIRYEVGNKLSLVGIYQQNLVIDADFPIVIPKLALMVAYYEIYESMKEDLILNIYFPHDGANPTFSAKMDRPPKVDLPPNFEDPDVEQAIHIRAPIIFAPLVVQQEGPLKVRMHCGDVITRLGVLDIRKATANEKKAFPGIELFPNQPPTP